MKIVTGNKNKQKEISDIIKNAKIAQKIEFVEKDLKEVVSDNIQIIIQKAKEASKHIDDDFIVEDITMYINNKFVPDIKWRQNELKENDRIQVILTIAKKEGDYVKVYEKRINGIIHLNRCNRYHFGFDNVVFINNKIPLGEYKEIYPLRAIYKDILKDDIHPDYVFRLTDIPKWSGKYQNED